MTVGDPQSVYSNQSYEKQLGQLQRAGAKSASAGTMAGKPHDKLYDECVEFESLFIKQMLNAMKKSVEKSEFLHGGMAEDIFEDMLYDQYSLMMAKNSSFGLADMVYRQLNPQAAGLLRPPHA
ncbi:MAG: rod-binding protein [Spirochaetales bacterium]|nr:rod-binding protein [Spirochaetales bacterium]